MARQYKTGLIITGDASGGIKAIQATEKELKQLNQGFDRGSQRSKQFARDAGGVSRELQVVRRLAAPVGAALAGMFAANSLRSQIDFADQLQKTNLRIGASTEALSQYNYVASLSGVQFKELATAWQRQSRRVAQAAQDTGEAQQALATLNLDAAELAKLAPEDQFERIAAAMNGVASEAQRVALAQKIWDSEGVKLLQIVNQGTDAIGRMRAEAEALGLTITQQTASDMAGFNDEMDRLAFAAQGVSTALLSQVVPSMTEGMQATSAFIAEMGGAEVVLERTGQVAGTLATVYLAKRLGPGLTTVGGQGLVAGRNIAAGMAMATGATGPLNRALVITQGRIAATAAAGRAMSASLALVGGPAGAAILAAGALYTFRDELGLTIPKVDASSEAVHQLTGELDGMNRAAAEQKVTELTNRLAELKAGAEETGEAFLEVGQSNDNRSGSPFAGIADQVSQIREIGEAAKPARQEMANVEEALNLAKGRLEELNAAGERTPPTLTRISDAAEVTETAAREQANALEALRQAMDPLRADHAEYTERLAVLNTALAEGTIGQEAYGEAVRWAAGQYVDAATGAEEYEKRVESLVGEYDRHHQQAQKLRDDLAAVNEMWRNDPANGDQYARMVANIRDEMRELSLEADPMAQEMARAWTEAADRIDETFADAFTGAFDSFDDFADQLLDGFKRLLAELAYQATLKPIVLNITGQMQGALGIPGAGGNLTGGGLGGNGGLFSVGKNLWSSAQQGLGNIAWSGAGAGGGLYSNVATGGLYSNVATGGVQSGFMGLGGSTANFGGATGLTSAGAGFAGNWAGQEVFGGGQTSQHLGQLGAIVGTYFGGPIGSAIGSFIGQGVGSAFSDKYAGEDPTGLLKTANDYGAAGRDGFEREAFATGALGDIGFARESRDIDSLFGERDDFTAAKEYAEQLAEVDNAIATLASSEAELEAMRRAAADHGLSSMGALEERYDAILGTLGGDFGEFVSGLDGDIGEVVERGLAARQAFDVMGGSIDRLGLQMETAGVSAYEAAAGLAEMVGGAQNLASLQEGFYQAFYSEAEQLDHLGEDLAARFGELGLELPTTDQGVRDLVHGLELMTEAGSEQYAAILQLVPQLDRYIEGLREQNGALGTVTDQQREMLASGVIGSLSSALDAYDEATTAAERMAQSRQQQLETERRAVEQLDSLLDSLTLSQQSVLDPLERLNEARRQYAELQVRAENGDAAAAGQLQGAAQDYLGAAIDYYGQSSSQYEAVFEEVTGSVEGLRDEFSSSSASIGDLAGTAESQLREQERARQTLIEQLEAQVDSLDGVNLISELLAMMPQELADRITGIVSQPSDTGKGDVLPDGEYVDDSGLSPVGKAINDIYQDVLGRNADQEGLEYWLEQLVGGLTLAEIRDYIEQDALDGSHRDGLRAVPFDGYRAELHRGELVATAEEAPAVRALLDGELPARIPVPVSMPSVASPGAPDQSAVVEELRKANARLQALEAELQQLREERGSDADAAHRQREDQLDAARRGNRLLQPKVATV